MAPGHRSRVAARARPLDCGQVLGQTRHFVVPEPTVPPARAPAWSVAAPAAAVTARPRTHALLCAVPQVVTPAPPRTPDAPQPRRQRGGTGKAAPLKRAERSNSDCRSSCPPPPSCPDAVMCHGDQEVDVLRAEFAFCPDAHLAPQGPWAVPSVDLYVSGSLPPPRDCPALARPRTSPLSQGAQPKAPARSFMRGLQSCPWSEQLSRLRSRCRWSQAALPGWNRPRGPGESRS